MRVITPCRLRRGKDDLSGGLEIPV